MYLWKKKQCLYFSGVYGSSVVWQWRLSGSHQTEAEPLLQVNHLLRHSSFNTTDVVAVRLNTPPSLTMWEMDDLKLIWSLKSANCCWFCLGFFLLIWDRILWDSVAAGRLLENQWNDGSISVCAHKEAQPASTIWHNGWFCSEECIDLFSDPPSDLMLSVHYILLKPHSNAIDFYLSSIITLQYFCTYFFTCVGFRIE